MSRSGIICWEALDPEDPALRQAHRLYEATQAPEERIPWEWIEAAVGQRRAWRPGEWSPHLLLAGSRRGGAGGPVLGFAYGIHLPGYSGYVTYLGVAPSQRRQGIGTRLLRLMTQVLRVDACCEGAELPFVIFESHRPEDTAPAEEWDMWRARLGLFGRAGALWISGLTLFTPSFAGRGRPPVALQLFLIPVDGPVGAFDADSLRKVAAGLLQGVYRRQPGDPLFQKTLPPSCRPALRPIAEALR
jgi:GNAT superfamily N-acetyltransferase